MFDKDIVLSSCTCPTSVSDTSILILQYGLEECCATIAKRQIGGDEFLHLTEGKLALWKNDLQPATRWKLWVFIDDLRRSPQTFVEAKFLESQVSDNLSDNESWDTDFEDDYNEDSVEPEVPMRPPKLHESDKTFPQEAAGKPNDGDTDGISRQDEEKTYANCSSIQDTYENLEDHRVLPPKNASKLHGPAEKSLSDQLKDQLKDKLGRMYTKKPETRSKPESVKAGIIEAKQLGRNEPQKSFLYSAPVVPSQLPKRMAVPPPPKPKTNKGPAVIIERPKKTPAKPLTILKNLDLVANLPAQTEGSEDEYEAFDEQTKDMVRVDSKQSLASHLSSAESVYKPPSSVTSYEEEEYTYEIYESITETPDDNNYYLSPIQRTPSVTPPPPLPAKPTQSISPLSTLNRTNLERSPDKKSATLPHSNSNTSLSSERATRPLPPPPERHSYVDKPWFHNVTREQATALITEQNNYGSPQDGYFLLRPSFKNVNNPLALVLWYKDRVYNVPVRKRPDNRFALGSEKVNELSFANVEEIVMFHTRKELILHSDGGELGSTKLTDTPPK
nr:B-cell linker protein-like isoform X2 [Nomia melanderi]